MTNLEGKPFALIGVNTSGHDAKTLKAVVDKERLTWRSFADPGELGRGAIASRWNLTATPTLYVIDSKGVIRYKWVGAPGAAVIEAALGTLISEAAASGSEPR